MLGTRAPLLFALVAAMACSATDAGDLDETCSGGTCDEEGSNVINGLPAAEYYALLSYQVDQERPLTPFRSVKAWGPDLVLDDGNVASANVYLMESGHYYLVYEEWKRVSSSQREQVAYELLEGSWSVDGITLVLGDVATAQGVDYQSDGRSVPGLLTSFSRDILGAGLAGSPMVMAQIYASGGLFHELGKYNDGKCEPEFGEFCAYGDDCGPCECGDGICQRVFETETADSCAADCEL